MNQPHQLPLPSYESLNVKQREAVESPLQTRLIMSGPGTGKTGVITWRIVHLIQHHKVPPSSIYAVTFTNKSANEMKRRLRSLLPDDTQELAFVGTFHQLCCKILRSHSSHHQFSILDSVDQKAVVKKLISRSQEQAIVNARKKKAISASVVIDQISKMKNSNVSGIDRMESINRKPSNAPREESIDYLCALIQIEYDAFLIANNLYDFDDLLRRSLNLLNSDQDICVEYANSCRSMLIDEFQDCNMMQYDIAKLFAQKHACIFAVGDPDQSIYSWRNADMAVTKKLLEDFPGCSTIFLDQNYRSTKNIVDCSLGIVNTSSSQTTKWLTTKNKEGLPVAILPCADSNDEASTIAEEILEVMSGNPDLNYGDFAILMRTNSMMRDVEARLTESGIPFQKVGTPKLCYRPEIKDLLAYLRLIENKNDSISFERACNVPRRGIGEKTLQAYVAAAKAKSISVFEVAQKSAILGERVPGLKQNQKMKDFIVLIQDLVRAKHKGKSVVELIDYVLQLTKFKQYLIASDPSGYETSWKNIEELKQLAASFGEGEQSVDLSFFLEHIAVNQSVLEDDLSNDNNKVSLSTFHSAKGLEFHSVFIIGVEEGILPYFRAKSPLLVAEERRLLFVAMTRAKQLLYLMHAQTRTLNGKTEEKSCSKFLRPLIYQFRQKYPVVNNILLSQIKPDTSMELDEEIDPPSNAVSQQHQQQLENAKDQESKKRKRCESSSSSSTAADIPPTKRRKFVPPRRFVA